MPHGITAILGCGKRRNVGDEKNTYMELFSVTEEKKGGEWVVTKYEAMY